jgi:uncharacterized membrane protein
MTEPERVTSLPAAQAGHVLLAARFATLEAAEAAYADLQTLERTTDARIDAVIVASTDADGRLHVRETADHSTKSGLKWGAVGGAVLGIIFPPSVLVSAVGLGVVGAAIGKVRNRIHRDDLAEELAGVLAPGTAGLVALAPETSMAAIRAALRGPERIVEKPVDRGFVDEIDGPEVAARATTPRA